MIISRFRYLAVLALAACSACHEKTADVPRGGELQKILSLKRNGSVFEPMSFLGAYRSNPNRYNREFFKAHWEVVGWVAQIPEYDKYGETLDRIDPKRRPSPYSLTLYDKLPGLYSNNGGLDAATVFISEFSREQAAGLVPGQKMSVSCNVMRVVSDAELAFDDCSLENSK